MNNGTQTINTVVSYQSSDNKVGIIVGSIIAAVAVLAGGVIFTVLWLRRKKLLNQ